MPDPKVLGRRGEVCAVRIDRDGICLLRLISSKQRPCEMRSMPEDNEPDSPALRWMRHIDTKLDLLADIARETRTGTGLLERRFASIAGRLDGIDDRLERIGRRLDLGDASA